MKVGLYVVVVVLVALAASVEGQVAVLQDFYSSALKAQYNICGQNNREMFYNTDAFNQSYKTCFFVNAK